MNPITESEMRESTCTCTDVLFIGLDRILIFVCIRYWRRLIHYSRGSGMRRPMACIGGHHYMRKRLVAAREDVQSVQVCSIHGSEIPCTTWY